MSFVDRALKPGIADEYALIDTGEPGSGKLTSWSLGKTNRFQADGAQLTTVPTLSGRCRRN